MSAGIEVADDGRATFVAVGEHGWHQLGTVVDHDITVAEGLELSYLADRDYRTEPILAVGGTEEHPTLIQAPGFRAVVRRNPFTDKDEVLGAGMKDSFVVHTPEQAFAFGENIIEEGKPLAAMGSIKGGRRAFAAFKADDITIGGVDQVRMYLNVMTAFDGSMSTIARISGIRVVCQNTFTAVMSDASQPTYRVRHSGASLEDRIDDARAALQVGWKGMEQFQKEAEAFLDREVSDKQFAEIVADLIPVKDEDTDRAKRDAWSARAQVKGLYDGQTVESIRGTAWGALNAYTEWADWTSGKFRSAENRMVSQITPGSIIDGRRVRASRIVAKSVGLKGLALV